jgi:hypothetical protein
LIYEFDPVHNRKPPPDAPTLWEKDDDGPSSSEANASGTESSESKAPAKSLEATVMSNTEATEAIVNVVTLATVDETAALRQKVAAAAAAASAAEGAKEGAKSSSVIIHDRPLIGTSVLRSSPPPTQNNLLVNDADCTTATTIPTVRAIPTLQAIATVQAIPTVHAIPALEKVPVAKLPLPLEPHPSGVIASSLSTKTPETIQWRENSNHLSKAEEQPGVNHDRVEPTRSSRIISVTSTNRIPRLTSASPPANENTNNGGKTLTIKPSLSPITDISKASSSETERSDIAMYEMMFAKPASIALPEELDESKDAVTDADRLRAMSAALPVSAFIGAQTHSRPATAASLMGSVPISAPATAASLMGSVPISTPTALAIAAPAAIAALKDKWGTGQNKPLIGSKIFSVCATNSVPNPPIVTPIPSTSSIEQINLKCQDMDTTNDKVGSFESFVRAAVFAPPGICAEKFNAVIPAYSFCACNLHHISQKQWIAFHCSGMVVPSVSSGLGEMVASNLKETVGGLWPLPKKTLPPRFHAAGFPKDICQLAYYGAKCDRTRCYHDHLSLFQVATLTGYPRQIPLTREQMTQMHLDDIASQSSPSDICTNVFNGRVCEYGQCCLYRHRTRYTFVRNQIARAPADAYTEAEMKQVIGLLGAGPPTFQSNGIPDGVCARAYCSIPCVKSSCALVHLTPSVFAAYAGMPLESLWLSPFWIPPEYCPAHYLTGRCVMKEQKECHFIYHQLRSHFLGRTNGLRLGPFHFIANSDQPVPLIHSTGDGIRALFMEWNRIAASPSDGPAIPSETYEDIFAMFALSLSTSQNITSWHDALISKQTCRFGFLSEANKDEGEQKQRDLWKWCRNIVVVGREERIRRRAERAKSKRVTLGNIPLQIANARRAVRKAVKDDDKKKRKLASSASALPDAGTFEDLIADLLTPEEADIECLDHL